MSNQYAILIPLTQSKVAARLIVLFVPGELLAWSATCASFFIPMTELLAWSATCASFFIPVAELLAWGATCASFFIPVAELLAWSATCRGHCIRLHCRSFIRDTTYV
jgi:hypothetical protein